MLDEENKKLISEYYKALGFLDERYELEILRI